MNFQLWFSTFKIKSILSLDKDKIDMILKVEGWNQQGSWFQNLDFESWRMNLHLYEEKITVAKVYGPKLELDLLIFDVDVTWIAI